MTDPGSTRSAIMALLAVGLGHHQAGRLAEAYDVYRRVLALSPGQTDALHLLGVVAYQLGQPRQSADLIRMAIARRGDNPDFYVNLGNALQALGDHLGAVNAFGRAAALESPLRAATLFNLGNALGKAGRSRDAIAALRQALVIAPGFAPAHRNLGLLLQGDGRLAEAEAELQRAVALVPEDPEARYALGLAQKERGQPEAAAASLRAALDLNPTHAAAHDALGSVFKELGRLEEAVVAYAAAGACDPDFAAAHYNLAGALQDLGRYQEALDGYRRCLDLDPANDSARHMVAALSGETTPTAPAAYVRDMFDGYAAGFERHLVNRLHYRAPELLRTAVDEVLGGVGSPPLPVTFPPGETEGLGEGTLPPTDAATKAPPFARVLDMGCGSGLVGAAFRDLAGVLDGVDLAPRMLDICRQRGIYDGLFEADVATYLGSAQGEGEPYDLLLAADLFIYIGDLSAVFAAASACCRPGGLFAFSVERLVDGEGSGEPAQAAANDYALRPSGRYAQSAAYVHRLAAAHGFAVAVATTATLRQAHCRPDLRAEKRAHLKTL